MFSCRFSWALGGLRPSTVAVHLKMNLPQLRHQNVKLKQFFPNQHPPRITPHCRKLHVSTWHMHSRDCVCLWVVVWLNGKRLLILALFQTFGSGTAHGRTYLMLHKRSCTYYENSLLLLTAADSLSGSNSLVWLMQTCISTTSLQYRRCFKDPF